MDEEVILQYMHNVGLTILAISAVLGVFYAIHILHGFQESIDMIVEAERIFRSMQQ